MCGLAALFAYRPDAPPLAEAPLLAMREAMATRGPDGAGLWLDAGKRVGLAHRRLAIIDLSSHGAQPMTRESATGRVHVVYNGEIYNFRELRAELQARGERFATNSDTEVLLALYARDGDGFVARLRGMFAFALWDEGRRRMLLARDPFGIKPLYYTLGGGTLRVASTVKALLAGGGIDTAPDPAGHAGFFLLGSVPEPHTLYKSIRALPAGHTLVVTERGLETPKSYFSLRDLQRRDSPGPQPPLAAALEDSVAAHMIADVPVGVFLSAGLDSTALAAFAARAAGGPLEAVTLGFRQFQGTAWDETILAAEAARAIGANHRVVWLEADDFAAERDRLFAAMDQPSIDGVNVFFVARAARRLGLKVAISGLGGDEMFGGYDTFRDVPRLVGALGWVPGGRTLGRALRVVTAPALKFFAPPKWAGLLEYGTRVSDAWLLRRGMFMPWELPEVMDPDMAREGLAALALGDRLAAETKGRNSWRAVQALETNWYMKNQLLRDADWAGMAHSLEIRVPLVDATLFAALAPWLGRPGGPDKIKMARAAGGLPETLLARPKTGFVVPVRDWMANEGEEFSGARGWRGWTRFVYRASGAGR